MVTAYFVVYIVLTCVVFVFSMCLKNIRVITKETKCDKTYPFYDFVIDLKIACGATFIILAIMNLGISFLHQDCKCDPDSDDNDDGVCNSNFAMRILQFTGLELILSFLSVIIFGHAVNRYCVERICVNSDCRCIDCTILM